MKRLFIILLVLFMSVCAFAKEGLALFAVQNAFQVETISIRNSATITLDAPSIGYYMSANIFEDGESKGFGISNVFSLYLVTDEVYLNDKILVGPSLKLDTKFPAAILSGVIIQPEFEKTSNDNSSFHFLIGMGMDFQLGTEKGGFSFGSALSIGLYPIMLASTTINGKTSSIDIERYGRVSIGISFGVCAAN